MLHTAIMTAIGRARPRKDPLRMASESSTSRRPLSLVSRSTIATLLVLIGFLGITGFALDRAYAHAALEGLSAQLQSYAYTYLAGFDVSSRSGRAIPPDVTPPNPDFGRPGSGLYAVMVGENGFHFETQSTLGRELSCTFSTRRVRYTPGPGFAESSAA